ncbi:MAG: hypothetical protein KatS3mg076_1631 [Candidatus Binatia bacterium]|nr:MAG: hypothetical protein KatS3mg076_1631 [Candidatus Binatia bacterium]
MNVRELLDRRLLTVVGKGGVGRSTVALALALEAARAGKKTLLVEVDGVGRTAQFLGVPLRDPGVAVATPVPGLFAMAVEGKAALEEYLTLVVPVRRVIQAVFRSKIYQYFVAAAPGLKELMTVGKIWYEAERTESESGTPLWDLVVVDAPATGHSLQYFAMPQAAAETFGAGLVRKESLRVLELLRDGKKTAYVIVTTAEEIPINETLTMYAKLAGELRFPVPCVVVNRVHESPLRPEDVEALAARLSSVRGRERRFLEEVLERAREERGWVAINRRNIERLRRHVPVPLLVLPFLYSEEFGLAEVRSLGERLVGRAAASRAAASEA